jgi:putative RecB family exonuclease
MTVPPHTRVVALGAMPLPLPRSLSPSKVSSFCSCPLAFKFSVIDRIPEPSSPAMVKGTLVHRALERLFWHHDQGGRSEAVALTELDVAWEEIQSDPEFQSLELPEQEAKEFLDDAAELVSRYFELEDPNAARAVGVELMLETDLNGMLLRGIIDRLDVDDSGDLVVVDYKTGRAPSEMREQGRLGAVQTYALLCERVLGRRPSRVRLLYLRDRIAIEAVPSAQSTRGTGIRATAVWTAISRACESDDFRPHPSGLCRFCNFRHLCPAVGGNLELAALEARRQDPVPVSLEPPGFEGTARPSSEETSTESALLGSLP